MKTKIKAFFKWMYLYVKGWREVYYNRDILPLELPVTHTHTHTHKARRAANPLPNCISIICLQRI